MGEARGMLPGLTFNRAVKVECRPERLSSEGGALVVREVLEKTGVARKLAKELVDSRAADKITHPLGELCLTAVTLLAQGWRDQDDVDPLRDDAVMRLAVSQRSGVAPLAKRVQEGDRPPSKNPAVPDGLASQPTLSRLTRMLSEGCNLGALRRAVLSLGTAAVQLQPDLRHRRIMLDIDSLPIEVHGHQDGAEWNGHYHARIFHPLIAAIGETGELLDLQLREGNAHTAEGGLDFITCLLDDVEAKLGQVAAVRIDAGFPEEKLLGALETRQTAYVARVRNNKVLDHLAGPYLCRPPGRPPNEPRTWFHELTYRAGTWSRERRVVLVVQEKPGELLLHHFWLITNWTAEQLPAEALLDLYRQRGTAEGHFGEFMNVLAPALSSSARPKTHYQQQRPEKRYPAGDSFAINEARLLLNALAYATMHVARRLLANATHQGWSLRRIRERVLRVAARVVVHARRATVIVDAAAAHLWQMLWARLARWRPAPD